VDHHKSFLWLAISIVGPPFPADGASRNKMHLVLDINILQKVKVPLKDQTQIEFREKGQDFLSIAYHLARYGMDVVDCGPALLSMHSPFEVASKADIFQTYKAYKAFYQHL
jgi:aspartyl aminopeptidase